MDCTVRDEICEYVEHIRRYSELRKRAIIHMLGIPVSRMYTWEERKGVPNRHTQTLPCSHAILPWEREAIISYCRDKRMVGYRRLSYMMIDENIACVSPATTYRILQAEGLLNRWVQTSEKKHGFEQPVQIHEDWHTDISYVNILGTFFFLIAVLDGYSRMILHHELRSHMEEYDVEIVLRRAQENYPDARPNLITDNGSQYCSKEFKKYIHASGLKHIRTSVGHPQSNGKIERFHKTIKEEHIRQTPMISIEHARKQIAEYITEYNEHRLHSGIHYLTPQEVFEGKQERPERQEKLDTARYNRKIAHEKRQSA